MEISEGRNDEPLEIPEHNLENGIFWLTQAAQNGNVQAQYRLGCIYLHGMKITLETLIYYISYRLKIKPKMRVWENIHNAEKWLKEASDNNHIESIHILGGCYVYGTIGKGKKKREGEQLLISAANQKLDVIKQYILVSRYLNAGRNTLFGQGFEKKSHLPLNVVKAEQWFIKAAEIDIKRNGLPRYKYDLARRYYYGDGLNIDYKKAKYWCEKCLEDKRDYIEPLYMLGKIYSEIPEYSHEYTLAKDYFEKVYDASVNGEKAYFMSTSRRIHYSMFLNYADGIHVEKDKKKAFHWADMYRNYFKKHGYTGAALRVKKYPLM